MENSKKKKDKRIKNIIIAVFSAFLFLSALLAVYLANTYKNLPSVEQLTERVVPQSTKIYDRSGKILLYEISETQRRTIISFDKIPQSLKDATIAIEDDRFYETPGFDWKAIIRAALVNIKNGKIIQGGSSITQQLAKNAFLSPERTLKRKIKEFLLALKLSRTYSKNKILSLYLNEIPYGSSIYGVESASRAYFGKSAKELSIAESALLAAIPKAPTYYSPWGNHTKELFARQRLVLKKMYELGKITKKEYKAALNAKITIQPRKNAILAPHFVMAVEDYLIKKYGEDAVRTGGLTVRTTLDWDMQKKAEEAVKNGAEQNKKLYNGGNAALLAQDPKTGQILAMVGSKDYFDAENNGNFNVATQGLRQPGSALKPFIYLTALEKGYTPDTVVFDVPTEFNPDNSICPIVPNFQDKNPKCFHPENFDGKFRGPVDFKTALAQSINVPAVKVLYLVGLKDALKTLEDFGITTLSNPNRYGLSLVLGGGEIKMIDLVNAYATLSQEGVRHKQVMVLEVKDSSGNTLESYKDNKKSVLDPKYPRIINNILSDIDLRRGLFSSSLPSTIFQGYDVALKTGTSNDYRDAWSFGYTPSLVVGVWAGNNDNSPMQKHGSSILASVPIWSNFMRSVIKNFPQETFKKPDIIKADKPILVGDYAYNNQIHSILYYVNKNNPTGPAPNDPYKDPQFKNWESSVILWAEQNIKNFKDLYNQTSSVMFYTENNWDNIRIEIKAPTQGSFVKDNIQVNSYISSPNKINKVNVYINGKNSYSASPNSKNYSINTTINAKNILKQQNILEVEAIDENDNRYKKDVIIYK